MSRRALFLAAAAAVVSLAMSVHAGSPEWSLDAKWIDSCSCDPSCPCVFGSKPTRGHCEGVALMEMNKASYDGVKLDGLTVAVAYRSKKWQRIIVSDNATKKQMKAMTNLVAAAVPFLANGELLSKERAPIVVERTENSVKFTAKGNVVELELMVGENGEAITLHNVPIKGFPSPAMQDHRQFRSKRLKHEDEKNGFDYEGTNGMTAHLVASSKTAKN